jgi:hypothetical protein
MNKVNLSGLIPEATDGKTVTLIADAAANETTAVFSWRG